MLGKEGMVYNIQLNISHTQLWMVKIVILFSKDCKILLIFEGVD
jgi:hypothetical protein